MRLRCLLCGDLDDLCVEYAELGGEQVCGECGEKIANAFSKRHSGQYLTWAEAPRAQQKPPIPEDLRWEVFKRDNFSCRLCGAQSCLHADHINPQSKGGVTELENLQTLCRTCNLKKGSK